MIAVQCPRNIEYLGDFNIDVREELLYDLNGGNLDNIENEIMSPVIKLNVWGKEVDVLLDSGSENSCINLRFLEDVMREGIHVDIIPVKSTFIVTAVGSRSQKISKQVAVPINISELVKFQPCLAVPNLVYPVILGAEWLSLYQVKLDFHFGRICLFWQDKEVQVTYKVSKTDKQMKVCMFEEESNVVVSDEFPEVNEVDRGDASESKVFKVCQVAMESELESRIHDALSQCKLDDEQGHQLHEVLIKYKEIFSSKPGATHLYEHSFVVKDTSSFVGPRYPVATKYMKAVEEQIELMLENDIIEPSASHCLNPLVVVAKKDNSVRLCIDARMLNTRIESDQLRTEAVEDLVQRFQGRKWFSTVDFSSSCSTLVRKLGRTLGSYFRYVLLTHVTLFRLASVLLRGRKYMEVCSNDCYVSRCHLVHWKGKCQSCFYCLLDLMSFRRG